MYVAHVCGHSLPRPSASVTLSGRVEQRFLITLAPSMTKICVALESAMAAAVFS